MPCSSTRCPGCPPYVLFPLTAGLPLMGSRSAKQPIWAAGDTPHLMPVDKGLPWHPVATGLAGQAIPFTVAASHAHALPSPPFWFPVPAVLVTSPSLLCPSLSAVLALVPPGVAPAFCVCLCCSSPCLLALLGAPVAHPLLSHPPAPVRGFHISVRRGLSRAWLAGHGPVTTPWRAPPGARGAAPARTWAPCRGRGGPPTQASEYWRAMRYLTLTLTCGK